MPKVSVIIPTYNCADYIQFAIESAINQSYKDIEIVVIDDGSTDNTKNILKIFNGKIIYIYQENKGASCARNTGIINSTGEYIALLDSDDIWFSGRLERQMAIFESDKETGLIHTDIIKINEENKEIGIYARNKKTLTGYISENILLWNSHIACSTVIFKRKCIDTVGMFDEKLTRLGVEDRDLWIRITKHYKALYIDEPLALYRIRKNSMSHNRGKILKARQYIVDKYCDNGLRGILLKARCNSAIYLDFADSDRSNGLFDQAKINYINSIKHFPLNFKSFLNLIKMNVKIFFLEKQR